MPSRSAPRWPRLQLEGWLPSQRREKSCPICHLSKALGILFPSGQCTSAIVEMPEHFLRGGQQRHRDSRDQQGVLYFLRKFHENISPELYQEKCQKRAVASKCPRRKNKYPLALPPPQKGGKARRQSLICCAQNASYCHWFSLSILKRLGFHKHENALI